VGERRVERVLERDRRRDVAALARGAERDPPHPRLECVRVAELPSLRERAGEGLLDDVLGGVGVADDRRDDVAEGRIPAAVQLLDRPSATVHRREEAAARPFL
jgi:hypothetical protein